MSDFKYNQDYPMNDSPIWKLWENNYNNYFVNAVNKIPVIPKKIHQVWVGSKIPDKYKRLTQTWQYQHPDWEYKLWTDDDVESFGMSSINSFNSVDNKGGKADIFRYEIVNRYGGIYADTDFDCIKPFDDFLHLDFFCGTGYIENPCVFNGLFGCAPKHPILQTLIDIINKKNFSGDRGYEEIMELTGAYFITNVLVEYMKGTSERIVIFPKNYFYPFPPELRFTTKTDTPEERKLAHSFIKPRTYAIHLWYTSWQK